VILWRPTGLIGIIGELRQRFAAKKPAQTSGATP
jgi:hypothetical protein